MKIKIHLSPAAGVHAPEFQCTSAVVENESEVVLMGTVEQINPIALFLNNANRSDLIQDIDFPSVPGEALLFLNLCGDGNVKIELKETPRMKVVYRSGQHTVETYCDAIRQRHTWLIGYLEDGREICRLHPNDLQEIKAV